MYFEMIFEFHITCHLMSLAPTEGVLTRLSHVHNMGISHADKMVIWDEKLDLVDTLQVQLVGKMSYNLCKVVIQETLCMIFFNTSMPEV